MNSKHSAAIKKIRETRQQKAANELGNKNEARDRVVAAKNQMDQTLVKQTNLSRLQVNQIYSQTSGITHGLQDLEILVSKVEKEKNKVAVIAAECTKLKTMAQTATEKAEDAKRVHAQLLRSCEKWDKVVQINTDELSKAEENGEEIIIEELTTITQQQAI